MKKYPAYKDSGVDWLGEIPEHWETRRSKFLWSETTNLSEDGNEQLLSVSQYDGVKTNKNQSRSENLIGYKKVCKDNLVTNIMLAWLGGLGISNFDGVVSPAYSIYQASNEILPRFAHYLYRTKIYLDEFARRSSGVVPSRWRMYTDDFGEVRTILPPKPEQKAIAHFLDDTCEKLDRVVAQKEKMIALLKERKQALIQKAVTRGLDENVDFKDSGVDWIGEIPVGWEVKRLRFLGKTQNGLSKSGDFFGSGFPFLTYGDVFNSISIPSKLSGLAKTDLADQKTFSVKENDVFFTRTSETAEDIGRASICEKTLDKATFAGFLIRFRPINAKLFKGFSKYYFTSEVHRAFFVGKMNLVIRASLSQDFLKTMPVLLPPIKEQKKIYHHLEKQSQKIDQAVSQQEQAIVKLREYKASLIDSCVLGKIKVT